MATTPLTPPLARDLTHNYVALRASDYSFKQLADIYNETRVDYIVPMPMNARRMEAYVTAYDIDLDASLVVLNGSRDVAGVGMVGLRAERAWITRLGVIPSRRGKRMGQFMMETLLAQAALHGAQQVQLEVIRGNDPAYHLFRKLGFVDVRELLVLRRPPHPLAVEPPPALVRPLDSDEAVAYLHEREPIASWLDETVSIQQAGQVAGLALKFGGEAAAWVVYRNTPFQLSHVVLSDYRNTERAFALLYHLHTRHPAQDTKLENLPADVPTLPAFERVGYHETFRRIEMILTL